MNGKSIILKPKELAVIKKRFENTRVKNDFYKLYNVDAGCINRVLELGRCSTKTYNKLLLVNAECVHQVAANKSIAAIVAGR